MVIIWKHKIWFNMNSDKTDQKQYIQEVDFDALNRFTINLTVLER